jgi:hypothetical protein
MIMRKPVLFVLWLAVFGAAMWTLADLEIRGSAQQNNLLSNGSFDNGAVGLALTAVPGWTVTRGNVMAAINAQARRIADFVNRVSGNGGALFAMGEVENSSNPGAWNWLRELFPGIVVTQSPGTGGINTRITLTTDGRDAFPGLTDTEVGEARPWHNYFSGDLATLKVLGVAPEDSNGPSRRLFLAA